MRSQQIVRVDRTLLDEARHAFKPSPITPSNPQEKIMYEAGRLSVIEWLEARISAAESKSTLSVTNNPDLAPDGVEAAMRRALKA